MYNTSISICFTRMLILFFFILKKLSTGVLTSNCRDRSEDDVKIDKFSTIVKSKNARLVSNNNNNN